MGDDMKMQIDLIYILNDCIELLTSCKQCAVGHRAGNIDILEITILRVSRSIEAVKKMMM